MVQSLRTRKGSLLLFKELQRELFGEIVGLKEPEKAKYKEFAMEDMVGDKNVQFGNYDLQYPIFQSKSAKDRDEEQG